MAKGKKYWELEKPLELSTEKNVIRVFMENGKAQIFPKVAGTAHGVGKGATIDLETMTIAELETLRAFINKAIDMQVSEREEGPSNQAGNITGEGVK